MTKSSSASAPLGARLEPEAGSPPASGALFTPLESRLPLDPTGEQLVTELRRFARINKLTLIETLALVGKGMEWLRALSDVRRPAVATVQRVRDLVLQLPTEETRASAVPVPAADPGPGAVSVSAPGHQSKPDLEISAPTKRMAEILGGKFVAAPKPSLAEEVAREAEAAVSAKAAATAGGQSVSALRLPAPAALQAALIDDHMGAMRAVIRRWPELWVRIVEDARASAVLPGEYFFEAVRVGLDALAAKRGAA